MRIFAWDHQGSLDFSRKGYDLSSQKYNGIHSFLPETLFAKDNPGSEPTSFLATTEKINANLTEMITSPNFNKLQYAK